MANFAQRRSTSSRLSPLRILAALLALVVMFTWAGDVLGQRGGGGAAGRGGAAAEGASRASSSGAGRLFNFGSGRTFGGWGLGRVPLPVRTSKGTTENDDENNVSVPVREFLTSVRKTGRTADDNQQALRDLELSEGTVTTLRAAALALRTSSPTGDRARYEPLTRDYPYVTIRRSGDAQNR